MYPSMIQAPDVQEDPRTVSRGYSRGSSLRVEHAVDLLNISTDKDRSH
jgi:hypothetical protein